MNPAVTIASMTVTEFRTFKKALRALTGAGVATDYAIEVLASAYDRRHYRLATRKWDAEQARALSTNGEVR